MHSHTVKLPERLPSVQLTSLRTLHGQCEQCGSDTELSNLDGFQGYMNLPATTLNKNEHLQDMFNAHLMNTDKDYKVVFTYGLNNLDRFRLDRELGGANPVRHGSFMCGSCL